MEEFLWLKNKILYNYKVRVVHNNHNQSEFFNFRSMLPSSFDEFVNI